MVKSGIVLLLVCGRWTSRRFYGAVIAPAQEHEEGAARLSAYDERAFERAKVAIERRIATMMPAV
jgi:hypothetical protein